MDYYKVITSSALYFLVLVSVTTCQEDERKREKLQELHIEIIKRCGQ